MESRDDKFGIFVQTTFDNGHRYLYSLDNRTLYEGESLPSYLFIHKYIEKTIYDAIVSSQSQDVCGNDNANDPYIAKALASTSDWRGASNTCAVCNNQSSNNATGFTACPAGGCSGLYDAYVSYTDLGYMSAFWSATENGSGNYDPVLMRYFYHDWSLMFRDHNDGSIGYSVRCLRN